MFKVQSPNNLFPKARTPLLRENSENIKSNYYLYF